MQRPTTTQRWMAAAFAGGLAAVLVVHFGVGGRGQLTRAVQATARWSFLWFWMASRSSALAKLFGARFQPLAARGRDFGLAFAAAHLVHVMLVAVLLYISATPGPRSPLIFFGIGVFWVYLLALFSFPRITAPLNPRLWRAVRTIGVDRIGFAFLANFAKDPLHGGARHVFGYLPFLALAIAGPALRLAAFIKRHAFPL